MQMKLTIAAAAAAFALASFPALAVEMPDYGSKNFTTPGVAPSYFTNENGAVTIRGPDTAAAPAADETDDATPSDVPLVNPGTGRHGKHASVGKSKGHGGSTHYAKAPSAKSTAKSTAARGGTQSGVSKTGTTKHAKSGIRQHAAVAPAPETSRASVA